MRAGLFGGTFDPIHRGHLHLASAAADALELDQVLFAPTGRQPLKSEAPIASFADRLAMVTLACGGSAPADPRFAVSALDAPHSDGTPNYTVDLLRALQGVMPEVALFVLAGADSFLSLRRWREPDTLLQMAEWIVVSRPGLSLTENDLGALELNPWQRSRVHLLTTVHEDVSATALRRRLASGDACPGLLPAAVAAYIRANNLYHDTTMHPPGDASESA